ncbi:MAG: winged helix-turn-helix domain-containing protein, partial [Alphaproteobacteria bacterium]
LILSALSKVDDRVSGLKAGGDDYLVKPFAVSELMARIEVLKKRASTGQSEPQQLELKVGDLHVNLLSRRVERAGELITLQAREYKLLEFLLQQKGQVVTRTMLLESVWDYHFDPQTNVIDVHISRLRKKLGDEEGLIIKTIRGAGYIVEEA